MASRPEPSLPDPSESRVPIIIFFVCFCLASAALALGLRLYCRAAIIKKLGVDDYIACVAFLSIFACAFCMGYNVRYGFGRHVYYLPEETVKTYMKIFYLSIVFYNTGLMGVKMTFLFQYYRVLAIQKRMRNICIGAIVLVGFWTLSQVMVETFICTPIEAFWDKEIMARPGSRCIPNYPQWYINAAGNITTDVLIFLLPLPSLRKLALPRGQKVVLLGIFCLGFFTCAISVVRIRFLHIAEDVTWENVEAAAWSLAEQTCGIICACLPTLRPLFSKWLPGLSSRVGRSSCEKAVYPVHEASGGPKAFGPYASRDLETGQTGSSTTIATYQAEARGSLEHVRSNEVEVQAREVLLSEMDAAKAARLGFRPQGEILSSHPAPGDPPRGAITVERDFDVRVEHRMV